MKNRRKVSVLTTLGGVFLLCLLAVGTKTCSAATIWSDNFDDGDSVGWTVFDGGFSVSSYTLVPTADNSNISYPSTSSSGTWSFDVLTNGQNWEIYFFADGLPGSMTEYGYLTFYYDGDDPRYSFGATDSGGSGGSLRWELGEWVSFAATRHAATGELTFWINGEFGGASSWSGGGGDLGSNYFIICAGDQDCAFDNIVVSNTIDITTGSPSPIPGFPIMAIAIGVATALGFGVLARRKRAH